MAQPGTGAVLKVNISSVLTAIVEVTSIKGPGQEVASIKTTHLSSTTQTYRPGLPDAGELTFEVWYDPAQATHARLTTLAGTPATTTWELVFADAGAAIYAFSGFVTKFENTGMEEDENLSASITVKLTGAITITP